METWNLKKGDQVCIRQYNNKGRLGREIVFDKVEKASILTIEELKMPTIEDWLEKDNLANGNKTHKGKSEVK